jgi:hypothetical protein
VRVTVLSIDIPEGARAGSAAYDAQVLLDVDGQYYRFTVSIRPNFVAEFDASLISACAELVDLFIDDQRALHQICTLVGQAARQDGIHLPQRIAA